MKQLRSVRQGGFSIIEVLVAAIIMSIGMLGLAGLQMRTLRNNQSALQRGVAVVETHAIIDAMRGDRVNAMGGSFNIALGAADPVVGTFANTTIKNWRDNLKAELGSTAKGSISCVSALCTIVVQWDDTRGTGGSATLSITTVVQI